MAIVPDPNRIRPALIEEIEAAPLERRHRPERHEDGTVLEVDAEGVFPATRARLRLVLLRFVGGGFAGQVYQARVEAAEGAIEGLAPGTTCAVKVLRPPSRFSASFRDLLYGLGFQAPFGAQVHRAAIRAGALWQRFIQRGAALEFGTERAVVTVRATFFEPNLGSWAEISEWVPGRTWALEVEDHLFQRWRERPQDWTTFRPDARSPEYLNKRAFMARLVRLFHRMGAPELARQYEWWSLKSQPNALKRLDAGPGPAEGLTAIDFRAGLALLPFLPMSPVDVRLVLRGLGRGALVQFDRGDPARLRAFVEQHRDHFADLLPALEVLEEEDRAYRRSQPDLSRQGFRLMVDRNLRGDVRRGLVAAWQTQGLCDDAHATTLRRWSLAFALFFMLGLLPLLGRPLRRLWCDGQWRRHLGRCLGSPAYLGRALRVHRLEALLAWHRKGRVGDARALGLRDRPVRFFLERVLLGWMPAGLHRVLAEPSILWGKLVAGVSFPVKLYFRPEFREEWLRSQVDLARDEGMLDADEERRILDSIGDPFIQTYLKCVAVHAATLPVTQVVALAIGGWYWAFHASSWQEGLITAGVILAVFQGTPISPGSLTRGTYVLYRMARDRNVKDYWVAALISFWHYVGYLGFPIQMVARFPGLARFLGGTWATRAARVIPVFGEKGALVEHFVFDAFFNLPVSVGRALRRQKAPAALPDEAGTS